MVIESLCHVHPELDDRPRHSFDRSSHDVSWSLCATGQIVAVGSLGAPYQCVSSYSMLKA